MCTAYREARVVRVCGRSRPVLGSSARRWAERVLSSFATLSTQSNYIIIMIMTVIFIAFNSMLTTTHLFVDLPQRTSWARASRTQRTLWLACHNAPFG